MTARSTSLSLVITLAVMLVATCCYGFYLVYPTVIFDSDHAIVGVMAKDLVEGRMIPWTYYGQKYMLAVEAWAVALSFMVGGVSLSALKAPLLVVNLVTVALLLYLLRRDARMSLAKAALATMPLIAPPVVLSAHLMANTGANPWVLMYVALIWLLRGRPITLGLMLGAAYFQREFVLMGFLALICTDVLETGSVVIKGRLRARMITLMIAFATYHILVGIGQFSPEFVGVGTPRPHMVDAGQFGQNFMYLLTTLMPPLLGMDTLPASAYGILTNLPTEPLAWLLVNVALVGAVKLATLVSLWQDRRSLLRSSRLSLPLYLIIAAVGQVMLYALFIAKNDTVLVRYVLMVPLALVGVFALALLEAERHVSKRGAVMITVAILSLTLSNLAETARMAYAQSKTPVTLPAVSIAEYLVDHGYHYGWANYWDAYAVSFISNERVIISGSDHSRVTRYRELLKSHENEAFVLVNTERLDQPGQPGHCEDQNVPVIEGRQVCPLRRFRGDVLESRIKIP